MQRDVAILEECADAITPSKELVERLVEKLMVFKDGRVHVELHVEEFFIMAKNNVS